MHDPRGKYNVGMGYAISEIGADHLVVAHDPALSNPESLSFKGAQALGIKQAPPSQLERGKDGTFLHPGKMEQFRKSDWSMLFGPAPRSFIHPNDVLAAIKAVTGWEIGMDEVLQIGERATNMARIFNVREGFSRKDDTLPERLFQPLENGALEGHAMPRQEFEQALTHLYQLKGWDASTGMPTKECLIALSLDWAADLVKEF